MTNTELPTQDGTYVYTMNGIETPVLTSGYVVATESFKTLDELTYGTIFGRWEDTETSVVYYDKVVVIGNLEAALALARATGELAIWDIRNAKEIRA
jgi:hypothetical protein